MYDDLYLDNLDFDIFIESTELIFESVSCNNEISLLLEDGNDNKKKNIIMRAVDAIMKKIREIIDWIKSKLFGGKNKKYEDFLKLADSKVSGLSVEFDKSPKKVYELYSDIFKAISKNYDKLSGNDNSKFIEEVKEKLSRDISKEYLSPKECIDLFYKYNKLSLDYKGLSDKISNYIKSKANSGIDCSQEQKALSLITRLMNDIRNNMSKISPTTISSNNSVISKVKTWANDNPDEAALLIANLSALGLVTGMAVGVKAMKGADDRIKNSMKEHDARMKAEKEVLDKKHKDNMKVLDEMHRKIDDVIKNVDLGDTEAVKKAEKEMERIRKQYRH